MLAKKYDALRRVIAVEVEGDDAFRRVTELESFLEANHVELRVVQSAAEE